MALDGIPDVAAEIFERIGIGEDGVTEGAGRKATLRRVFNKKYQFVHCVRANRPLMFPTMSAIRRFLSRTLSSVAPSELPPSFCYLFNILGLRPRRFVARTIQFVMFYALHPASRKFCCRGSAIRMDMRTSL
jgi:hypothetical protein